MITKTLLFFALWVNLYEDNVLLGHIALFLYRVRCTIGDIGCLARKGLVESEANCCVRAKQL